MAALRQAGMAARGVRCLTFSAKLEQGFLRPELWEVVPGLSLICDSRVHRHKSPAPVTAFVRCFAAAPREVVVEGLRLEGVGRLETPQAQLAQVPGYKVQLA